MHKAIIPSNHAEVTNLLSKKAYEPLSRRKLFSLLFMSIEQQSVSIADRVNCINGMQVTGLQKQVLSVKNSDIKLICLSLQLKPASAHFNMLGCFIRGVNQERENARYQNKSAKYPLLNSAQVKVADDGHSTEQKSKAEQEFKLSVKLGMSLIEFYSVANSEFYFVLWIVLILHSRLPSFFGGRVGLLYGGNCVFIPSDVAVIEGFLALDLRGLESLNLSMEPLFFLEAAHAAGGMA